MIKSLLAIIFLAGIVHSYSQLEAAFSFIKNHFIPSLKRGFHENDYNTV